MTLRKDIPLHDTVGTRPGPVAAAGTATEIKRKPSPGARLFALAIEIPPVAYVAITGDVPGWIRGWLIGWLLLWLSVTVALATKAGSAS